MKSSSKINSKRKNKTKMNYKYNCLNPIADCGLGNLPDNYTRTENFAAAVRLVDLT